MCGIAGLYRFPGKPLVQERMLQRMGDFLVHRGPDDRGFFISSDQRVGFTHTRLSIIDLTQAGHQPMACPHQKVWVIFNGEIYNFRVLKQELLQAGYQFSSESDTEILILGYVAWGIDGLLERLRGMFAFALYDARVDEPLFFLCRDRFGIKPLYWFRDTEGVVFASEVGALRASGLVDTLAPDTDVSALFLMFGHLPADRTTWKGIYMLTASSYARICGTTVTQVRYYDRLAPFLKKKRTVAISVIEDVKKILQETVELHLISDAPLGVFLSGGIDSSALVALASRRTGGLVTLSVDFDVTAASETRYQQLISQKYQTLHHQVCLGQRDFWQEFERIFLAMDQPTVDGVNTYFISRAARLAGLKTVLAGTGADEIFCGYRSFRSVDSMRRLMRLPMAGMIASYAGRLLRDRWGKLQYLERGTNMGNYLCIRGLFSASDVARLLGISYKDIGMLCESLVDVSEDARLVKLDPIDWLSYEESCWYLQNQLLKDTDCMSMAHSLETRVPYVDHVLYEAVAGVHSSLKVNSRVNKPLLVNALGDLLPAEIVKRKKQGFMFPIGEWMKQSGREIFEEVLLKTALHKPSARQVWSAFESGKLHWSRAWALMVIGKWFSRK